MPPLMSDRSPLVDCTLQDVIIDTSPQRKKSPLGCNLERPTTSGLLRTTAIKNLKITAPLNNFKVVAPKIASRPYLYRFSPSTAFPRASREHSERLFVGPTVRLATSWDAKHDSPGPQAYNEIDQWQRVKTKSGPCVRIATAQSKVNIPTAPGPGDYEIPRLFTTKQPGQRHCESSPMYHPRAVEDTREQVPCSYDENFSSFQYQFLSRRQSSPAFSFGTAPRFQARHQHILSRSPGPPVAEAGHPQSILGAQSGQRVQSSRGRRGGKRRRRRGCHNVFQRNDYTWLRDCMTPCEWTTSLRLTDNLQGNNPPRSWGTGGPHPVIRQGERCNKAAYDPLERTLPRPNDCFPGPKYDPYNGICMAGSGASRHGPTICSTERFPMGPLFPEEEVALREATPGPETYDVILSQRLESMTLDQVADSTHALVPHNRWGRGEWMTRDRERVWPNRSGSPSHSRQGSEEDGGGGSAYPPCTSSDLEPFVKVGDDLVWHEQMDNNGGQLFRPSYQQKDRQLIRSPCIDCSPRMLDETGSGQGPLQLRAGELTIPNTFQQAQALGASICFGDIPSQQTAPSFTIGKERREVASKRLHVPCESIYREERLGRASPGPTTAVAGIDRLIRPHSSAARLQVPCSGQEQAQAHTGGGPSCEPEVAIGPQSSSKRPNSPSYSIPMALRACDPFHDWRLYKGKEVKMQADDPAVMQPFFDEHIPK